MLFSTEPDMNAESDAEDPGYIIVLPDGEAPQTNQSRASTPSSDNNDYENVPKKKDEEKRNSQHLSFVPSEDRDYLNVERLHCHTQSDSDDDNEGNYVNVQDGKQTA